MSDFWPELSRLFSANDVDSAATVLTELVNQPLAWPALGRASRQRAEAHGWPGVLAGYTPLYEEVIRQSRERTAFAEGHCIPAKRLTKPASRRLIVCCDPPVTY